jgi:hypothetical protein
MTGSYFYNKIILIFALVAFLVGGFFPVARAAIPTAAGLQQQVDSGQIKKAGEAANPPSVTGAPADASKNDEIYCFDFGGEGLVGARFSMTGCLAQLSFKVLQLASWVLWVAAVFFNATINYTLNIASFIKDIPIVDLGWTVFRDVTNLLFIFIILYIAINTIIGNEGYGIKKLLGKVIIGAMLINFSLFFTQAMIDASNIFALQFYHKITQDAKKTNTANGSSANNSDYDSGISAAFVNAMGLQQVFQTGKGTATGVVGEATSENTDQTKLGLNASNLIIVGLGGTVLVLITAFVFFAGAMMLLARTVVLVFLMILSPIAFMGNILPALGKYTGEWWSKLTSNLLFAPIYMMLLYLVINMVTGDNFKKVGGGKGNFADLFAGGNNWDGTLMTFVILIMLMVGCLLIASKLGVIGGKWAEKTGIGFAKGLGMTLSGAGLAMGAGSGIARSGLGVAGGALTTIAKPLASSGLGRVIGGSALLRGGQALKDVKVGGKSYKDALKAKEEKISKEYEAIKDTNTNIVQGRWESDESFKKRKDAADALEIKNQIRADKRIGVTVDQRTGKVTKKSYGVPSIFGGTTARYNAQKKLSKGREGDVDKSIKKPYEKKVQEARESLKGALHDQKQNDNATTQRAVNDAKIALSRAQRELKNLFSGGGGDGGGAPAA